MIENNPKPPAAGDAEDDALMRFVIDTARDDVPTVGAKARLLGSSALKSTAREASRPRGSLLRIVGGRAGYGIGLAVLAAGGAAFVGLTQGGSPPPPSQVVSTEPMQLADPAPTATPPTRMPTTTEAHARGERGFVADVAPAVLPSAPVVNAAPVARPRASATSHVPSRAPAEVVATNHEPAVTPSAADVAPSSTLDREIARIAGVRAELAKGDGTRALALLDSYDAEFPSGAFALDVTVLRIEALARSGRTEEARRLGERFLATHPQSASARRVAVTLHSIAPQIEDSAAATTPR